MKWRPRPGCSRSHEGLRMEPAAIAILGPSPAWLSQDGRPRWALWVCIVGLAGQPFWMTGTWRTGQ